jgi:predicted transcriptional regulator
MPKELADTLRAAIRNSGISEIELARRTGVPQSRINDFMNGGDMRLTNAGKIAKYLGLELKKSRR